MIKKNNLPLIVVGTVAVAAVAALFGSMMNGNNNRGSDMNRLLEANTVDGETETKFNSFISKHHKSYLTKEEYKARLSAF